MEWLAICCLLSYHPSGMATDTLYGTYIIPEEQISLNLSPPNNYTMFMMEYNERSESVNSQELSRGQFSLVADTVVLEEATTGKAMKLLATNEETLHPLNVPSLDKNAKFLGQNQYHANGELKWEGEWRRGKKHGTWVYYNESGDVVKSVRYKRGKKME
ncbi:toxin-antitoxin system YwqK family antitoxin [Tunicatimonas pelagia]|uniref:toxin-antitoxin system YwqK family antitoxin n=1 Tax=Tunicatimonas pelagia TaxID=931531 RepID=UPI002665AD43|nr:hypothetical protein [Tunicatimonas pelagia]WKN46147.1 hypothetical protein P0M28_14425 [Tunicatimonas pelagia]